MTAHMSRRGYLARTTARSQTARSVSVEDATMNQSHPPSPAELTSESVGCEQRTSRMELLWPPSLRARVVAAAQSLEASINEVVLHCIEYGLLNEQVLHAIEQAASRRRTNSRLARRKDTGDRAA